MLPDLKKLLPTAERPGCHEVRSEFVGRYAASFRGKRAFVVGNGTSLQPGDLDRLVGEISFGANLIHLVFSETDWRPNFVSVTDSRVWSKLSDHPVPEIPRLVDSSFQGLSLTMNVVPFKRLARLSSDYFRLRLAGKAFSRDIVRGYFGGYSVTFFNIQLAFSLGLNPVYLMGVDHLFRNNESRWVSRPVRVDSPSDHFHPDYRSRGEVVNSAPVRGIERAMSALGQIQRETGFTVVDLTRGGRMPGLKRESLDSVLGP